MTLLFIIYIAWAALSLVAYAALMIYYKQGLRHVYKPSVSTKHSLPNISVVVCFRNEEEHLPQLLKSLVAQSYPISNFEILLYNDASNDGSLAIVKNMMAQFQTHQIICKDVPVKQGSNSPKKLAINEAALQSKADLMVVTDADCILNSEWLVTLAQCYIEKNAFMVSAPVAIKDKGGWLVQLQKLEMIALTAVTAGAMGKQNAIMCNGANMGFDRIKFLTLDPYKYNMHIRSGDDMFLLSAMQKENKEDIYFLAHQNAVVYTKGKTNIKTYLNQRIRWASKSKYYQAKQIKLIALLVLNVNVVVTFSPLILFYEPWIQSLVFFTGIHLAKHCADALVIKRYTQLIKMPVNYLKLLTFQYAEALLTLVIAINSIKGSYVWKDRKEHF